MLILIKIRRDTSEQWEKNNPVLREKELAADTTLHRVKIGDGVTDWQNLGWCDEQLPEILASGFFIYYKDGETT